MQLADIENKFIRNNEFICKPEYYVIKAEVTTDGEYKLTVIYNFTEQTIEQKNLNLSEFTIGSSEVYVADLNNLTIISKEEFFENIHAKYKRCISLIINKIRV